MSNQRAYAVLGSTGNCGLALMDLLTARSETQVHAYCRDKAKLMRLLPDLKEGGTTKIFEGSIEDQDLMKACLWDSRAVFLCVSTNDNIPGCNMAQKTAAAVISALRSMHAQNSSAALPKVVLLSSGTVDEHFRRNMPSVLLWVLLRSASHVYNDILEAELLLRAESSWLTSIVVKPAMLSVDMQRGHALDLDNQDDEPLSYLDLAAGMVEAVDDREGRFDGRDVSVVNRGGKAKFPQGTPLCIVVGLLCHYFPWMHAYLPANTGPK